MVKLGDEVKDSVSGFKGIAVGEFRYLNGCSRWAVQPRIGKDGKLPEAATFDEPQLIVTKECAAKVGKRDTGGPAPYMDKGR